MVYDEIPSQWDFHLYQLGPFALSIRPCLIILLFPHQNICPKYVYKYRQH